LISQLYALGAKRALSNDPVDGSPRFTWLMALPVQGCVLPAIAALAWWKNGLELMDWLVVKRADLSYNNLHDAFLYVFFGYMVKDFSSPMSLTYWLHHGACALLAIYFLEADFSGLFICGATVLELGSTTNTVCTLWPGLRARAVHVICMTASNWTGLLLLWLYILHSTSSDVPVLVLVGMLLIFCRQYHCICSHGLSLVAML